MTQDNDTREPLLSFREAFELYENGKHRRYELLFAVNGGAFAVVKLLGERSPPPGKLPFAEVAAGMILFTIAMVSDTYTFGKKWHRVAKEIDQREHYEIFGTKGRRVLKGIGALLCVGWLLFAWQS